MPVLLATQHQEPFGDHGCSENRASEMVLNRLLAGGFFQKMCYQCHHLWLGAALAFFGGGSGKLIKKARRNWFIFHKPCLTTGGYTCTSWALLTISDAYMRFVVHFDQGHRHPLKYGGFLKWGYPNHWLVYSGRSIYSWFRGPKKIGNLHPWPVSPESESEIMSDNRKIMDPPFERRCQREN